MQPSWWVKIRNDYIALVDDRCLVHHGMNFLRKHLQDFPGDIRKSFERVESDLYFTSAEEQNAQMALTRWVYRRLKEDEKDEGIWGERKRPVVDASRIQC
jgi:hypothetical protein